LLKKITWAALGVLALAFLGVGPAQAQQDPIRHGGWGGVSFGVRSVDVDALNDFLSKGDVGTAPGYWTYLGGQGHAILFDRMIAGVRGGYSYYSDQSEMEETAAFAPDGGVPRAAQFDDLDMELTATTLQIDLGYAVFNGRYRGLGFVYAGLGAGRTTLKLAGDVWQLGIGPGPGDLTFADRGNLVDRVTMSQNYVYTQVGFSYIWPVRFGEGTGGGFGAFMPGVTVGANLGLTETAWYASGEVVQNAPHLSPNGFFLQGEVSFGGGVAKP
jgi:hypothetical protein